MSRVGIVERVDSDSAPCKTCGEYLPSIKELIAHRQKEHGEGVIVEFPYDGPINKPRLRCPVCREVYFRIGTRAWRDKRLRVCTNRCRAKVHAEVRKLRESSEDDAELVRRRVAWRYMREGGQI